LHILGLATKTDPIGGFAQIGNIITMQASVVCRYGIEPVLYPMG